MKKTIICQSNIIYGGRLAVIVDIIKLLNDNGITPTVLTSSTSIDINQIKSSHNIDFKLLIRCKWIKYLPYELQVMIFGICVRLGAKNYDLIINSNNTSIFFPSTVPIISYTHYPRKARVESDQYSIHFPEYGATRGIRKYLNKILKLLYSTRGFYPRKETILANSKFTKDAITSSYRFIDEDMVRIVYPGVVSATPMNFIPHVDNNNVVSLGRISPDKKQLEQIKIFGRLPYLKLTIAGYSKPDNHYYKKCLNYIEENKIPNVEILINISENHKSRLLSESKYYLHMTIAEPFGITIVEAIEKGCIPIVHDSGGAKEIVHIDELRYSDDMSEIIKQLVVTKGKEDYVGELHKKINSYSKEAFNKQMWNLISKEI